MPCSVNEKHSLVRPHSSWFMVLALSAEVYLCSKFEEWWVKFSVTRIVQMRGDEWYCPCTQRCILVSFRFGYFGKEKLKEIKLLVCNIDGCLTNGHIYVSGDQKEIISYDVKDAIGISLLKKSGIEVCAP